MSMKRARSALPGRSRVGELLGFASRRDVRRLHVLVRSLEHRIESMNESQDERSSESPPPRE